uniref:Coclaurine N-methyltransferase n=1 Tax=Sinopodophyllum hexandrum TaxID=93608 RepID=A0A0B4VG18_SINHE|nr:coclaurine N-methyltransferase [Sinopodophyllum hexandrum]
MAVTEDSAHAEAANNMEVMQAKTNKAELLRKLELGVVPDHEIKQLIRHELDRRLRWGYKSTHQQQLAQLVDFAHSLRRMNIADEVDTLDSNIYEVPISFLRIMNGPMLKGSGCYFPHDSTTLAEAEIAMLDLYCERAQVRDGHTILDLGCGQGALTLHIAKKYTNCRVTAITNSVSQKHFIQDQCIKSNLTNVEVLLADITKHDTSHSFDRVFVIELLEHMKNYELLLKKISKWMSQDGLLFIEHICHKTFAYHYDPLDEDDWFTDYVFPAGTMIIPSASFLLYFQDDVSVVNHWTLSGKHFSRTNEEWLKRLDANVDTIKAIFEASLGSEEAAVKLINYWKGFCFSGMEMFGSNNGEEWMTSHLLLTRK